jgi:putative FmdB family regulatory protein|tara:strand:+ start:156 stop:395 length:240 start_codon:yes stop_codon:yes gene_type:complete
MARYDYKCSKCEHVFEVQHSIHEEPKVKCEKCKKLSIRQISTRVYLYGTVGIDWNSNPMGASQSMKDKARKASKKKQQF